ncbi:MAG: cupredoxin domain-containing protein [Deltaproteobacteria bacterium]|nr:cupredoxin domain-containing protein [Deltaproteobacteria bacterium]MBI2364800.1 cupredoxin domain-containing protein [Deltaproteobacteria bacterium]
MVLFAYVMAASVEVFAQQAKEFRITANEFSFKPSSIQVPRGEVKISVTNRGKFLHGLAIVGRDEKIGYIESGETESLTVNFDKAGEAIFYCPQPGHRNKGMEGKLTVGR